MDTLDPHILGLSRDWWSVMNVIGTVVASLGTMAAVVISLWVVLRGARFRGVLTVEFAYLIGEAEPNDSKFLQIRLANTSDRNVKVTAVGWRVVPWDDKGILYQFIDPERGIVQSPLPHVLAPGEDASWFINLQQNRWFDQATVDWKHRPRKVYVYAGFSDGKRFEQKVGKGVLKAFQQGFDRTRVRT